MRDGVNIFVAGQTGSGKSYMVKQAIADAERLVVYLPKREDCGYAGVYFDALDGKTMVPIPNGSLTQYQAFLLWWKYSRAKCGRFRLVYRPADKFDADEFNRLCGLVYSCSDCTFICEECSAYLTTRIFATVGRYQAIRNLLTAGRTRGVTCYWVTQRCFGVPREVTSEARDAYLFRLQEPADLDYVQERFGIAARLKLDQLQQYQYVHWQQTGHVEVGKA